MTQEEFIKQSHDILQNFLDSRPPNMDGGADAIKCTMAQFLLDVRNKVMVTAIDNQIRQVDLINIQIKALHTCILDLESVKNNTKYGDTVQ